MKGIHHGIPASHPPAGGLSLAAGVGRLPGLAPLKPTSGSAGAQSTAAATEARLNTLISARRGESTLSDREFRHFRDFIYQVAGISLSDAKKPLVAGRLSKRLRQLGVAGFQEYYALIQRDREEMQAAVNALTTNETYFFREPRHFDFLKASIIPALKSRSMVRIWSGACSSGEEPYTIAMILAEALGTRDWEIVASDLSTRVLELAMAGQYVLEDAKGIPRHLLQKYCLKGVGSQEGTFLIDPKLAARVKFRQINLNTPLPDVGMFDVIFLRNVMIYFDMETKRRVVQRLVGHLRPGGHFIVSHSETLNGLSDVLLPLQPSVYQKRHA